jgi:hypothetical protein
MTLRCCFLLLAQAGSAAPKPGDWRFGWVSVGIVAGVAVAIILVTSLIMRWFSARERRSSNSPWQLFKDLVAAHDLNHRERNVLTRLAQQFRLEQPATLFVEPAWWEPERLGPAWSRRLPELEKLRRRLFALR